MSRKSALLVFAQSAVSVGTLTFVLQASAQNRTLRTMSSYACVNGQNWMGTINSNSQGVFSNPNSSDANLYCPIINDSGTFDLTYPYASNTITGSGWCNYDNVANINSGNGDSTAGETVLYECVTYHVGGGGGCIPIFPCGSTHAAANFDFTASPSITGNSDDCENHFFSSIPVTSSDYFYIEVQLGPVDQFGYQNTFFGYRLSSAVGL